MKENTSPWAHPSVYPQLVARMMRAIGDAKIVDPPTWYEDWGKLITAVASEYGYSPEHAASVFAALSPQKSIARNWAMYLECLSPSGPENCKEATKRNRAKVRAMLESDAPMGYLNKHTGPKTWAFAHNLLGDSQCVTVDSIMAQCATDEPTRRHVPRGLYRAIESAVKDCAILLGWTPAEVQAAVWLAYRNSKPTVKGRGNVDPDARTLYAQLVGTPD